MLWIVEDSVFDDIDEAVEAVIDGISENEYTEYLNEVCDTVNVCGYEFRAGDVLKKMDYITFRAGYCDWTVSLSEDVQASLKSMSDGDSEVLFGVYVEADDD